MDESVCVDDRYEGGAIDGVSVVVIETRARLMLVRELHCPQLSSQGLCITYM
jgi:hypothetical protein